MLLDVPARHMSTNWHYWDFPAILWKCEACVDITQAWICSRGERWFGNCTETNEKSFTENILKINSKLFTSIKLQFRKGDTIYVEVLQEMIKNSQCLTQFWYCKPGQSNYSSSDNFRITFWGKEIFLFILVFSLRVFIIFVNHNDRKWVLLANKSLFF
jgi:hypothetical protein